ncbi:MAG: hypothetical protein ACRENE_06790 [Polyangiaceae bacterium]
MRYLGVGGCALALLVCAASPALAQSTAPSALPPLPALPPPPPPAVEAAPTQPPPPSEAPPDTTPQAAPPAPPAPRASPPASPRPPPEEPQRTWYGWQTLLVDGASFLILFAGTGLAGQTETRGEGQALAGLFLVGYLGGGPTVHWAHGHVGRGFGSLGLRVGLPMGGALLGLLAAASSPASNNGLTGIADIGLGFVLGIIAAPIVDAAWLAFDDEPQGEPQNARALPALRLTPIAGVPRDASGRVAPTLGVGGVF